MEEKLSKKLTDILVKDKIVNPELAHVYFYGLELLISFVFSSILILLIGTLRHKAINTIIFLIVFILLRRFTGGYHAPSFVLCQFTTVFLYLIVVKVSVMFIIGLEEYTFLYILGSYLILKYCPIVNKNKSLTQFKRSKNRLYGFISFSILCFSGYILSMQSLDSSISNTVFFSICSVIILILISILKGGLENAEND